MSTIFLLNLTLKSARKLSPFLRSIKKPLSQPFKKVLEVSLPSSQSVDESGTLIRKNLINVLLFLVKRFLQTHSFYFLSSISRSFSIVVLIPLIIAGMKPASSKATTPATVVPPGEETWSTSSQGFSSLARNF